MPSNTETEHIYYEHDDQDDLNQDHRAAQEMNQESSEAIEDMQDTDRKDYQKNEGSCDSRYKYRQNSNHHSNSQEMTERSPDINKRSYDKNGVISERRKDADDSASVNESSNAEALPRCTLYVRNLPTHLQSDQVRSYFSRYGEVTDCRIVINPVTKESRGFGFVTYPNVDIADNAMSQMDQTEIDGRILRVEKARRNKPHDPTPGEYKGPTGASIKYDNRGRLRPGYVPYWDLPPPRATDRGRATGGRHYHHDDYHNYHHRSRSHPKYSRHSHGRDPGPRGRSPSSHYYHHGSSGHGGYYYSPSPASRDHISSTAKDSRYYYDDYSMRRRQQGDDFHHRGSSYRQHEGSGHHDSASPPLRRGGPPLHWERGGGGRQHYSPNAMHHRSSYSSVDRQRHRHHHEGKSRQDKNYYPVPADANLDYPAQTSTRQ